MMVRAALTMMLALSLACGGAAPSEREPAYPPGVTQPPITMYMTSWCPVCQRARDWLEQSGYAFEEYDVEVDVRAGRIMRSVNPRGTVPMFDIGGRILIGFDPDQLRETIDAAALEVATRD